MSTHKEQKWYDSLQPEGKYVSDLIIKHHDYFKNKDKKYRRIVHWARIAILLLSMTSTIILGLKFKNDCWKNVQINIGLVLSAVMTFLTTLSSFFNFEKYWMRNISIHIELNKLRDNFIYEAEANKIDEDRTKFYLHLLDEIQSKNIEYWKEAINKI
jgi:hypothetical protein